MIFDGWKKKKTHDCLLLQHPLTDQEPQRGAVAVAVTVAVAGR